MASTSGREGASANAHALSTVTARFQLHLHPSKTQDILGGVKEQMDMSLMRYSEDLDGVVLAYSDEKVTASAARLHPYFPFLAVSIAARVTLFCPRPGQTLVGRVNKVGTDFVGLLVLGVFNASIGADHIRREFKCTPGSDAWISLRDATHRITLGTTVRFTVESVLDHGGVLSIAGSLQEPGTGAEGHRSVRAAMAAEKAGSGKQGDGSKDGKGQQQQRHKDKEDKHKDKDKKKKHKEKEKEKEKEKKRKSADGGGGGSAAKEKRKKS